MLVIGRAGVWTGEAIQWLSLTQQWKCKLHFYTTGVTTRHPLIFCVSGNVQLGFEFSHIQSVLI